MNHHPRMGTGPEITTDEFDATGRAEFARIMIWQLQCSGRADDPAKVEQWFKGRSGIDQETRKTILTTLFPPRRCAPRRVAAAHS